MPINSFKHRWGKASLENMYKLLKKGGRLSNLYSPFPLIDETILDFKGLTLDSIVIKNSIFEKTDFSFSSFVNVWLENSEFKHCIFNNVDFSQMKDHGNQFNNCIFFKCKFNYAAIGYYGSKFQSCKFEACNFNKSIFTRAEFEQTLFINNKIKSVDFNASSFENCIFEGLLDDVWFRGNFASNADNIIFGKPKVNVMKNVSFENALIKDITLSDNCDLSTVKINNNTGYYLFDRWYDRLLFTKSEIQSWPTDEIKEANFFINNYLRHAVNQDWYIISSEDMDKYYGKKVASRIIYTLKKFDLEK